MDPLLSTGFPLTLLGLLRLTEAIETSWGRESFPRRLEEYADRTLAEADSAALLVSALYASFHDFALFAALSKLYFAAASFAEAARRLSRSHLARSFLCADHPVFGPAFGECCRAALAASREGLPSNEREELLRKIDRAIEPLDVAGLSDAGRRNWHPVRAEDLVAAASRLGATPAEVENFLHRSGFFAPTTQT